MKLFKYAALSILTPSILMASEFPRYPEGAMLASKGDSATGLRVECKLNEESLTLLCDFLQMTVSYELDPDDLKKTIAKDIQEIEEISGDEAVKEVKSFCLAGEDLSEAIVETETQRKLLDAMMDACHVKSADEARKAYKNMVTLIRETEATTCKIWPNKWQEQYHLEVPAIGENYWLSDVNPSGDCGVMLASTLKQYKDYSTLWQYDSRRIVTNKDGAGSLIPCSDIGETSWSYGWRKKQYTKNCTSIKFGF